MTLNNSSGYLNLALEVKYLPCPYLMYHDHKRTIDKYCYFHMKINVWESVAIFKCQILSKKGMLNTELCFPQNCLHAVGNPQDEA